MSGKGRINFLGGYILCQKHAQTNHNLLLSCVLKDINLTLIHVFFSFKNITQTFFSIMNFSFFLCSVFFFFSLFRNLNACCQFLSFMRLYYFCFILWRRNEWWIWNVAFSSGCMLNLLCFLLSFFTTGFCSIFSRSLVTLINTFWNGSVKLTLFRYSFL